MYLSEILQIIITIYQKLNLLKNRKKLKI